MNNRKEILRQKIGAAGYPKDEDHKELAALLENPAMQRALFQILKGSDDAMVNLINADFTHEEGVKKAIRLQARAHVYALVVDELLDLATTEPQPEETPNA